MPSFALLLGAGASWSSGVKTATEMMQIWRNQLHKQSAAGIPYDQWTTKQSWYQTDDEYSTLFEALYDEASQRRDHIELALRNARPSLGYVYLVNLLKNLVFNVVFTTNFDDLINEACFLYSEDLRPIVCAHDSAVSTIRITKIRPKIIKLHGDFLFDNIRNTRTETQTLDQNMKDKLVQFLQEYGLIVIGYSGRDQSIMGILTSLLKEKTYLQHGLYWCIRKGDPLSQKLRKLIKNPRVRLIEIPNFDEFMACLHDQSKLDLPDCLTKPYHFARDRARLFTEIPPILLEHSVIKRDVDRILKGIADVSSLFELPSKAQDLDSYKELRTHIAQGLPPNLKGSVLANKGHFEEALKYYKEAYENNKDDSTLAYEIARILQRLQSPELKEFTLNSPIPDENKTYFLLFTKDDARLIDFASEVIDQSPGANTARINRAIAYKRLGRKDEMNSDLKELEIRHPDERTLAGIAALRGQKEYMFNSLDIALGNRLITLSQIREFPVFEDYKDDKDFIEFIRSREIQPPSA